MALTIRDCKYYFDEGFMLTRARCPKHMDEALHSHDFVELVYIWAGKGMHIIGNNTYQVSKGDLLFMNYGCTHSFYTSDGFEYINILIKPDYVNHSLRGSENAFSLLTLTEFKEFNEIINTDRCFIHFSESEQKHFESLLENMENEVRQPSPGGTVVLRASLDILLTTVFRKMSLPLCEKMKLDSELMHYIKQNCDKALTLKKLAAMCFYNPSYFSRAFKAYSGMGFTAYLAQCRVERACELLSDTDMKIDTIIQKCGITNKTKFFKVFAKTMGCSPLQYRKSKK